MEKPPEEKDTAQRPNRFRNRSKPVLQFPVGRITRVPLAAKSCCQRQQEVDDDHTPRLLLRLPKER
ncbi:hypothetical protein F2Q69_00051850 [Brassica cretica]|uniref:Uncharacterized protein n=1 Tax=Brassica cretica TaxID=69181 RepID=A0A8S9PR29_BRACR|nr:hypothetical protein F2Q69_00051850 [Brassica cretica]